jgi:hypothetical protein
LPLAADSDGDHDGDQSDSAVDDEDGASEEDNTQDLVDRTRGELGSAIRNASSNAAGKLYFEFKPFSKMRKSLW